MGSDILLMYTSIDANQTFTTSLSWPKHNMKANSLCVVQQEHNDPGRKSCWEMKHEYRRATEMNIFSTGSVYRAPSKLSDSTDVVFPNSSMFIGSKNSPNLTKRKCEMKSQREFHSGS